MTAAAYPAYSGDPVAVIGNGPVGQTAALLLARWGLPVMLLDKRESRDAVGSKAICQQRDVLDVWSSVGARQIADEGLTWTTARTFYRDRELFSWSFRSRERSPLPPFVNISQTRTEEILDACIATAPLIRTLWSHDVTEIVQDDGGVTLRCRTPLGHTRLRAPYAIAAAGGRADGLRDQLGVSFDGHAFDDRFLICDIRAQLDGWQRERRFYFDPEWNPDRQMLIHPCPDSTYRIDWQVPPDFDLDVDEASGALDARIRKVLGDRPYEIVWKSAYRFQSRLVDRMRAGRVLLAGDFAHLMSPFGARGLNSGVADAENAAWKLAFVLHGWARESLLDSYDDERLAAARENLDVTTHTMRFLAPQTEGERRARRRLLEAAAVDRSKSAAIDSGRLAEPFWYVDSPLTTPDASRPFAGRPPRGETPPPAPGILIPDMPIVDRARPNVRRLREIVRDGLLALVAPGADRSSVEEALRSATGAPRRAVRMERLCSDGEVVVSLGAKEGEVWLVRPDGYVAAVLRDSGREATTRAARRALQFGCATDPVC